MADDEAMVVRHVGREVVVDEELGVLAEFVAYGQFDQGGGRTRGLTRREWSQRERSRR